MLQRNVKAALSDQRTVEVGAVNLSILQNALGDFNGIQKLEIKDGKCQLTVLPEIQTADVSQFLFDKKIVVNHLVEKGGSLEKQFLKILPEQ